MRFNIVTRGSKGYLAVDYDTQFEIWCDDYSFVAIVEYASGVSQFGSLHRMIGNTHKVYEAGCLTGNAKPHQRLR